MGFGLTFIGYFIAYVVSMVFPFAKIVGYAFMIWGCIKLSEYNTRFRHCLLPLGFLGLAGLYSLVGYAYEAFGLTSVLFAAKTLSIVSNLIEALDVSFHACLLIAVCSIAKETELPKMAYKAMRNLLVVIVAELAYFVALFIPAGKVASIASYIVVLLRILWVALNTVLLANCYKMICPEGEEDMPVKESSITIIRKMDEVINKREDEAKQAAENLVRRRRERNSNQNNQKNKNKKRK